MYRETSKGLLSVAPYLQPAPREGKVPAEMTYQDSRSLAEDARAGAKGHAREVNREYLHGHRACLEGFSKALVSRWFY